jgi:hypothetical protein
MIFWIGGAVIALGVGVWVGLGMPGTTGREDRVVEPGRARRGLHPNYIDYFRARRRR